MRPSLQVGNCFSGIDVTSTPGDKSGEVYDLFSEPGDVVTTHNFASYHNRYTNLLLLSDFRERMEKAGMSIIYNREVLGIFESEEGLFFPLWVWEKSIEDSLDWVEYEEIEKIEYKVPGSYYLSIDPNKFKQMLQGDYAAYTLDLVSPDRSHVRMYLHSL